MLFTTKVNIKKKTINFIIKYNDEEFKMSYRFKKETPISVLNTVYIQLSNLNHEKNKDLDKIVDMAINILKENELI